MVKTRLFRVERSYRTKADVYSALDGLKLDYLGLKGW